MNSWRAPSQSASLPCRSPRHGLDVDADPRPFAASSPCCFGYRSIPAPAAGDGKAAHPGAQESVASVDPPTDRPLPIEETGDVFMQVEKETEAGLIVSGQGGGDRRGADALHVHR